jgi:hypothetical protein
MDRLTEMKWVCVAIVALSACASGGHHSSPSPTPLTDRAKPVVSLQQRADAACRAVAPHDFVNAQPTTVGEIHAIPGPEKTIAHAYSNLLPGLPASAFAAWCWRQPTPHTYVSYVVGPSDQVTYDDSTWNGEPAPPPGPETLT